MRCRVAEFHAELTLARKSVHAELCVDDIGDQNGNISHDKAFVISGHTVD